ncbi:uncharacterized protein LOC120675985 isoform X2 [Panicum virgatum]|uniref:DUF3615 domain-containing protein n=1 Tax=Panicum virgatum TaxID=38727 RepID=A0A8T0RPL4_PANVG|nr:uncharacterized protein LOC120675985 isoform X2 [Panicum virgatum]KAG2586499.1 hypothetical protein PVAP13_5NG043708 [Panicum virgatum]
MWPLSTTLDDFGMEYYVEAARRLPLAEIPELAACINVGGHCFGLADPVSNIILNAVGLLVHRELARYKPPKTCPLIRATTSIEGKVMSMKSLDGLLAFMTGYFRHLSRIQEPAFELDVICGVNEPSFRGSVYHVNFLARSDGEARPGHTLFFAELGVQSMPEKSSSCSPVYDYIERVGRCSFCEEKGSKIIHPPSGGHFGDLNGSLVMDVSHPHERRSSLDDLLLEMDYVYFDPARDGQIAKKIDSLHSYCQATKLDSFQIGSYRFV